MDDLVRIQALLASAESSLAAWGHDVDRELRNLLGSNARPTLREAEVLHASARAKVGEGPWEEYYGIMDELADRYLEVSTEQREIIRVMFEGQDRILYGIHGYISRTAELLQVTKDPKWLWRGLAATSIEDRRIDYRDTILVLGDLHRAAKRARIKPLPYFRAVAKISNSANGEKYERTVWSKRHPVLRWLLSPVNYFVENYAGNGSTQAMLQHFDKYLGWRMPPN